MKSVMRGIWSVIVIALVVDAVAVLTAVSVKSAIAFFSALFNIGG